MKEEKNLGVYKTPSINHEEKFQNGKEELNFNILEFWAWNQSDLVENRNRGILAEFLVKKGLKIDSKTRLEWDSHDFEIEKEDLTKIKIEVKSSAYIQAWEQKKYSTINFSIAPTKTLLKDNNYSETTKRQADVYIFCLLKHKVQKSINPMQLDQWEFYLVLTRILNEKLGEQKTLSLTALEKLPHIKSNFKELLNNFNKLTQ